MDFNDYIYEIKLEEYITLYDNLMMNLIMVQNKDIEFFDKIKYFINEADYNSGLDYKEGRRKIRALIKFFKANQNIGYSGNIFLDKSGAEIYYQLKEFYEEVLNEEYNEENDE